MDFCFYVENCFFFRLAYAFAHAAYPCAVLAYGFPCLKIRLRVPTRPVLLSKLPMRPGPRTDFAQENRRAYTTSRADYYYYYYISCLRAYAKTWFPTWNKMPTRPYACAVFAYAGL